MHCSVQTVSSIVSRVPMVDRISTRTPPNTAPWMARSILLLALPFLSFASPQQIPSSNSPIIPVIGTVKSIAGDRISIEEIGKVTQVLINSHTEVWKGKPTHDPGLIQVGGDFSARCFRNAHGDLIADSIWLNIINYPGVITALHGDSLEMNTNPDADPQSGYVKEHITVTVNADTIYEGGARNTLKLGVHVQVIGVDLRNGKILATRVFFKPPPGCYTHPRSSIFHNFQSMNAFGKAVKIRHCPATVSGLYTARTTTA